MNRGNVHHNEPLFGLHSPWIPSPVTVAGNRLKCFFTRQMRESTLGSSGDLSKFLEREDNQDDKDQGNQEE